MSYFLVMIYESNSKSKKEKLVQICEIKLVAIQQF